MSEPWIPGEPCDELQAFIDEGVSVSREVGKSFPGLRDFVGFREPGNTNTTNPRETTGERYSIKHAPLVHPKD